MHGHNYHSTLIAVADDCPVTESKVPALRGGRKTVAVLQYEMLSDNPFGHTQEEVLFEVWRARQPPDTVPEDLAADELDALRTEFFGKGQPCLRASPLTKTHGWGVLFDEQGRAALCAMESDAYATALADDSLTHLKAMRSKRA
jgi:hypothetical protein